MYRVLAKHLPQTPNAVEPYVVRPSNQTAYIHHRTEDSLSCMFCTTSINADGVGLKCNAWLCSWRLTLVFSRLHPDCWVLLMPASELLESHPNWNHCNSLHEAPTVAKGEGSSGASQHLNSNRGVLLRMFLLYSVRVVLAV